MSSSAVLGELTLGEGILGGPIPIHLNEGIGFNDTQARTTTFLEEEGISVRDGIIIQTIAFGRLGEFELAKSRLGFSPIPLHLDEGIGLSDIQARTVTFLEEEGISVRVVMSGQITAFGRLGEFELAKSILGSSPIPLHLDERIGVIDDEVLDVPIFNVDDDVGSEDEISFNVIKARADAAGVRDNVHFKLFLEKSALGQFELGRSALGFSPIVLDLEESLGIGEDQVRDIDLNRSENVPVRDVLSIKTISFGRLGKFELGKSALGFSPIVLDLRESLGLGEAQIRDIDMNRADITDIRDVLSLTKIGIAALGTLVLGKGQLGYHYWTVELSEEIGINDTDLVHLPIIDLNENIGVEDIKKFMVLFLDEGIGVLDDEIVHIPLLPLDEGIGIAELTTFNIPAWAGVNGTIVISVDITKDDFCNLLSETSNDIQLEGDFVAGILRVLQTTQKFSENLKLFAGEAVLFLCPTTEFDIGDVVLFDDHEYEVVDFIDKFIGENMIYRKLALRRTDITEMEAPIGFDYLKRQMTGLIDDTITANFWWNPNIQPHFDHFRLYVKASPTPAPTISDIVNVSKQPNGTFSTADTGTYYAWVSAIDIYGNEGPLSYMLIVNISFPP